MNRRIKSKSRISPMPDWLVGLLVVVGSMAAGMLAVIGDRLRRIVKLLEIIVDELSLANRDKRDLERREKYPDLPY